MDPRIVGDLLRDEHKGDRSRSSDVLRDRFVSVLDCLQLHATSANVADTKPSVRRRGFHGPPFAPDDVYADAGESPGCRSVGNFAVDYVTTAHAQRALAVQGATLRTLAGAVCNQTSVNSVDNIDSNHFNNDNRI